MGTTLYRAEAVRKAWPRVSDDDLVLDLGLNLRLDTHRRQRRCDYADRLRTRRTSEGRTAMPEKPRFSSRPIGCYAHFSRTAFLRGTHGSRQASWRRGTRSRVGTSQGSKCCRKGEHTSRRRSARARGHRGHRSSSSNPSSDPDVFKTLMEKRCSFSDEDHQLRRPLWRRWAGTTPCASRGGCAAGRLSHGLLYAQGPRRRRNRGERLVESVAVTAQL